MKYLKIYKLFEATQEQDLVDELEIKLWTVSFKDMETLAKWEIEQYDTDKLTKGGAKGYPKVNISRHYTHKNSSNESDWYDYFRGLMYNGRTSGLLNKLNTTTEAWWVISFIFDPGAMYTRTAVSDIVKEYGDNLDQYVDHLKISFDKPPKSIRYCPYSMGEYKLKEWTNSKDILNNYEDQYIVGIKFEILF